jgi:hypothetical protein
VEQGGKRFQAVPVRLVEITGAVEDGMFREKELR